MSELRGLGARPEKPNFLAPWQEEQEEETLVPNTETFLTDWNEEATPAVASTSLPSFMELDQFLQEKRNSYERLDQETVTKDPELMEIIYRDLENRNKPKADTYAEAMLDASVKGSMALTGGSTLNVNKVGDYREMDPAEAFELWQRHQRSHGMAHTITVGSDIVESRDAPLSKKEAMAAGYMLWESMDASPVASWDFWEGVGQGIKDAVWDPTTILSLGVLKGATMGATKATALGSKIAMKNALKAGASKTAIRQAAFKKAARIGTTSALLSDVAMEGAKDYFYQGNLLRTGAQEEYSKTQTAVTAVGQMLIPVAVYGAGKGLNATLKYGEKLLNKSDVLQSVDLKMNLKLGAKAAKAFVAKRVKVDNLKKTMDASFDVIDPGKKIDESWESIINKAGAVILDADVAEDVRFQNNFLRQFMLGAPDGSTVGYFEALKDNGFVVMPSVLAEADDRLSKVFGDAITFLDDTTVSKVVDTFEAKHPGKSLPASWRTAEGLRDAYINTASAAGQRSWIDATVSRLEKAGKSPSSFIKAMTDPTDKVANPRVAQYIQSKWKEMLTSSLATTGANLKGFGAMASLNTVSQMIEGVYWKVGQYSALALDIVDPSSGWDKVATKRGNMAYGSILSAARVGQAIIDPEASYKYTEFILDNFDADREKLFRHYMGDAGTRDSLEFFNIKGNKVTSAVERTTAISQGLALVRAQDEVTKKLYFAPTLDRKLMQEYGMSPKTFFDQADAAVEMQSDRFLNKVLRPTILETQEVTASKSWNDLPQRRGFRAAARNIEKFSSMPGPGFVLPFGRFLNVTMQHFGDYSGINAVRHLGKVATGQTLDMGDKTGVELLAKATVGFGVVAMMVPEERQKIKEGIPYSQSIRGDSSINNSQWDWPIGLLHLSARIVAHATEEEDSFDFTKVPEDLWVSLRSFATAPEYTELRREGLEQVGAAGLRDVIESADFIAKALASANKDGFSADAVEILVTPFISKFVQGFTRPLEPINTIKGYIVRDNLHPDRSQGGSVMDNGVHSSLARKSFRYIDHLTGLSNEWEPQAVAGKGLLKNSDADLGKLALGVRSSPYPTMWGRMANAAEMDHWDNITRRFTGPPEVRNALNQIVGTYLEREAQIARNKEPDYWDLSLKRKREIMEQVNAKARERANDFLAEGLAGAGLPYFRSLSAKSKQDREKVMKALGLEDEDPRDWLDEEGGTVKLKLLDYWMKPENMKTLREFNLYD